MKARLFSWLEGTREEMTREEIGLMVREFMDDLERWLEEGRDYKVVACGLERVRVRLLVSSEMSRSGDGMKKKGTGRAVRRCRPGTGGTRDPARVGRPGKPGVVRCEIESGPACRLALELVQDGDCRAGVGAFPGEGVVDPGGKVNGIRGDYQVAGVDTGDRVA